MRAFGLYVYKLTRRPAVRFPVGTVSKPSVTSSKWTVYGLPSLNDLAVDGT